MKRRYGSEAKLLTVVLGEPDWETGQRTETITPLVIKRAIVLPNREKSEFVYDIAFMAANKNFTAGGFFNTDTIDIIVDGDDLPSDYSFDKINQIEIATYRYEFVDHKDYMQGVGYVIRLKRLS